MAKKLMTKTATEEYCCFFGKHPRYRTSEQEKAGVFESMAVLVTAGHSELSFSFSAIDVSADV